MRRSIIGIAFLVSLVALYLIVGSRKSKLSEGVLIYAAVDDASGLPVGTPVHLAGIPVGVIESLAINGSYADLGIRLAENAQVFRDATLFKQKPSILSGPVLELNAGTESAALLDEGDRIAKIIETQHLDDTLRDISQALPDIGEGALSWRDKVNRARDKIKDDVIPLFKKWDSKVETFGDDTNDFLSSADTKLTKFENSLDFDPQREIQERIDKAVDETGELVEDVEAAQPKVDAFGDEARVSIAKFAREINEKVSKPARVMRDLDEGKGTLGRLIEDQALAHSIDDGVQGVVSAVNAIAGWTMGLTLRTEFNVDSGLPRFFFTLRAQRRPDNFYVMELAKGGRGKIRPVLTYDPSSGNYVQGATIEERLRFTMQWAKQYRNLTFRGGLKESSFGAGLDAWFFDKRLRISTDVFDLAFSEQPNVRLSGTLQVYGGLYATLGVDDLLNPPSRLPINALASEQPIQFEEYFYGRDYFVGGELRFNERDLATFMFLGRGAIASLLAPVPDDN